MRVSGLARACRKKSQQAYTTVGRSKKIESSTPSEPKCYEKGRHLIAIKLVKSILFNTFKGGADERKRRKKSQCRTVPLTVVQKKIKKRCPASERRRPKGHHPTLAIALGPGNIAEKRNQKTPHFGKEHLPNHDRRESGRARHE